MLLRTFQKPTPVANDNFGYSVAAVGSNVLVGASRDDTGASNAGAAYLFDSSTGALLRTFLNPTPAASDYFGCSVAAVGSNVAHRGCTVTTPARPTPVRRTCSTALQALCCGTFQKPTPSASDYFGLLRGGGRQQCSDRGVPR